MSGLTREQTLTLRAPAKVNLFLEVCGKRPDGYHELRMFLAPISLCDQVHLEVLADEGRIEVLSDGGPHVPAGEGNLCHRAARFYFAETGVAGGVRVRIAKSIPAGAGLGGGSSDAAVTILGLERLYQRPLPEASRRKAAFAVGADVPFFFARGPAWAEGIGEAVRPAPRFAPLWLALVQSGAFLPTGQVFSRFTRGLTTPGTA
ncbi:MAG: 4-(cytidine 5'-diphospho)-2-C-methyl-D-erythritol kinase, partial [Proteobacteria bacterium]|nr:4-(cytidine 5'-diphospho)-2-C-methyl-D-erythritol kinase [Pseudomonadota bacterium]